jgi:hypothetical protein
MTRPTLPPARFKSLAAEMERALSPALLDSLVQLCLQPLHSIAPPGLHKARVVAVLNHAVAQQWFAELADTVVQDPTNWGAPLAAEMQAALADWRAAERELAPQSPREPKAALVLYNQAPFVDRSAQRDPLDRLLTFQHQRVMVVRGVPATGKTHLVQFIRHLVEGREQLFVAPLYLGETSDDQIGPRELMQRLADRMGLSMAALSSDTQAQEARLAEKLCDAFIGQTQAFRKTGDHWVLVLDGLNSPKLSPGAKDLVDRLIIAAARGDLSNVCLVLLALDAAVPAQVAHDVDEHQLLPLAPQDLREHVQALAQRLGRTLDDAGADGLVQGYLLDGLSLPPGHEAMDQINKRLRRLPQLLREAA